ncbi:uncharacterized protein LOC127254938 isoform X2 [Andrographis paniculata]|uniref:uncharacterized protein LOC127254938 isoform X2 n=1 Tax=Andrographis paniculata TaxID=175694 RepID=UPI0021E8D91F|nr:uncharacterized protein LOC127254938 isoform X2 [Andrographis paniculata]
MADEVDSCGISEVHDVVDVHSPVTSVDSSTSVVQTDIDSNVEGPPLPDLGRHGVIDLKCPIGVKGVKTCNKTNRQRQRRIKKHDELQACLSETVNSGLVAIASANHESWTLTEAYYRRRELRRDEDYKFMFQGASDEHEITMTREIESLRQEFKIIGQRWIAAKEKLKLLDPNNLVTEFDKLCYAMRKEHVEMD